ncbi:hypothetical protein ACFSTH_17505 [Paenibacillus yanchengensis]|uniref:HEAT repeat domain-containing protein n=1 Tax=Paenibacillus yanchengensis TaxID=2035833 RepID=A0ABW4YR21_9BACL
MKEIIRDKNAIISSVWNYYVLLHEQTFDLRPIENLAKYMEIISNERAKLCYVSTLDKIGVVPLNDHSKHSGGLVQQTGELLVDAESCIEALQHAVPEIKLAAIRNLQFLSEIMDNLPLAQQCSEVLWNLGMEDESKRLLQTLL